MMWVTVDGERFHTADVVLTPGFQYYKRSMKKRWPKGYARDGMFEWVIAAAWNAYPQDEKDRFEWLGNMRLTHYKMSGKMPWIIQGTVNY